MVELTLLMPIRLVSTLNMREHWSRRARRAAEQRAATRMRLAVERAWPLHPPLVVTITRIAPRALDSDNLAGACKAVRDGIADALGLDDGSSLVQWRCAQRRGAPKEYATELTITEVTKDSNALR